MKKTVDAETKEVIESFVAEGYERLDDAEVQLQRAECVDGSEGVACLNSVFRLFHSVKGSAGFLGFNNIKLLTHEAETLLDALIKGRLPVDQAVIDLILKTADSLREMIALVEREYSDEEAGEAARKGAEAIGTMLGTAPGDVGAAPQAEAARPLEQTEKAEPIAAAQVEVEERNVVALSELVTVEMVERFFAESADLVDEAERRVLALSRGELAGRDAVNELFRAIHTIKGNAGFFGHARLEALCMDLEGMLDRARRGEALVNEAFINGVIARLDGLRATIAGAVILDREGKPHAPESRVLSPPARAEAAYKPLGEILVDLGVVREEEVKRALDVQERPLGEILVESGAAAREDVEKALELQRCAGGGAERAVEEIQRKEIRVDTAKLDRLFELVGELITAEAMVLNSPDLAGLKLDHFTKAFNSLNKISRDIQETAMMIRMIPLEGLFHKMTRLVRDLSRKFDKPVDFRYSGQDTEMDKNVIEQVSDPLVHILRNAIDHGLEPAAERAARGKPASGAIRLEAKYEGSEIWISVRDDGAGLDREAIVSKALEKGLIQGDPALLCDEDVWKLIFEPGFSTAKVVTEVSGRGVGMDVVKKNLERIRGRVDIKTERGKGTEFILKIPLTMAIIDGITVRAGRNFYSIPLGDILEFLKVHNGQITRTERGEETVNIRGSILPLIKLGELFAVPDAILEPEAGIVMVVQNAGVRACLLIDEVVGNQQIVVKSLSEFFGKIEGISGCSILGDGSVSFIIDTGRLIARRLD